MSNFRIAKGLKLRIHPHGECVIHARLSDGEIRLCRASDFEFFSLPEEKIVEGLFSGAIEIIDDNQAASSSKKNFSVSFVEFATHEQRKEALRRYQYIAEIIRRKIERITKQKILPVIADVARKIEDLNPPSNITVYRWYRRFIKSSNDIRSLIPFTENRGNREAKLSDNNDKKRAILEIIDNEINIFYLTIQRPSIAELHSRIAFRINDDNQYRSPYEQLRIPHKSTIFRRVKKLDSYLVDLKRYGKRYAEQKHKTVKHRNQPERPLEIVEIDHTVLDLFVVDDETGMPIGRPTLTVAIDKKTAVICGFYLSFHPPSYISVMNCLLHAIQPKTYLKELFPNVVNDWDVHGVMEILGMDNAAECHGKDLEDAAQQAGFIIQYHPPKHPYYKGSVERWIRTLNQQLLHTQPGTTFSNIFELKDYDPKKNAIISFSALIEAVHIFIVDIYHQEIHRGINDIPARRWKNLTALYPPLMPARMSELKILLGAVEQRTVSSKGIAWNNLQYNCEELGLLRRTLKEGQKVTFKYNPIDISVIYVADPSSDRYITVPALWQEYAAGLTLWQHTIIQRFNRFNLQQEYDLVSICKAKEKVRQIVSNLWHERGKIGNRKRMARFFNYGANYNQMLLDQKENLPDLNPLTINPSILTPLNHQIESSPVELEDSIDYIYNEDDIDTTGFSGSFTLHDKE
jgi:putative transposase